MRVLADRCDDAPALIEGESGQALSYAALRDAVDRRSAGLAGLRGCLVFLGAGPTVGQVVDYLALLEVGATTALLDPATPADRLDAWVTAYQPDALLGFPDVPPEVPPPGAARDAFPDRILLPTSGTTGSPKFVRLSQDNLRANADQIVTALRITPDSRALTALPLFFSYGLSVLNSHLDAGASVVLSSASSVRPEFARVLRERRVTAVAGVPFSFQVFQRLRLFDRDLPDLRQVTVAGGKLATESILAVSEVLRDKGIGFWTMYGQTEATARICVLPPEELPAHAGSVGWPVPGMSVEIVEPASDGVGEIRVQGPNVMLGYARSRADVGSGDQLQGRLDTGDLGRLDAAGRLWVHGRIRRITKVFGLRVSLDDVEAALLPLGAVAAMDGGDQVVVIVEGTQAEPALQRRLQRAAALPPGGIRVVAMQDIPRTPSGKVDHDVVGRRLAQRG